MENEEKKTVQSWNYDYIRREEKSIDWTSSNETTKEVKRPLIGAELRMRSSKGEFCFC